MGMSDNIYKIKERIQAKKIYPNLFDMYIDYIVAIDTYHIFTPPTTKNYFVKKHPAVNPIIPVFNLIDPIDKQLKNIIDIEYPDYYMDIFMTIPPEEFESAFYKLSEAIYECTKKIRLSDAEELNRDYLKPIIAPIFDLIENITKTINYYLAKQYN